MDVPRCSWLDLHWDLHSGGECHPYDRIVETILIEKRRPLSECFGRRVPLLAAFVSFTLVQLPVITATSPVTIFILRFLQGFFGAAPSSILSGTLADIWTPKQRGFAMPAVGSFLTIGPILGPLVCHFA